MQEKKIRGREEQELGTGVPTDHLRAGDIMMPRERLTYVSGRPDL